MPQVFNKRNKNTPADAIYIGRPSKWGNPYAITANHTRKDVVWLFKEHLLSNPELLAAAKKELAGKNLVCWCTPLACHGDILIEIANK